MISTSPKYISRLGGVFYLLIIITGIYSALAVRGQMVDMGDAALTVQNISANVFKWRTGIVSDLIMQALDIPVMIILFLMLRPVDKILAMMALLFNVIQTAVLVVNKMNLVEVINLLDQELPAEMILHRIQMHELGFGVGLIFFGLACLIYGYLIRKSGFIPATIGILIQIAGACYLVNTFAILLDLPFADSLFPFILLPPFLGELTFSLWLIIKGVDNEKWKEKAGSPYLV